MRVYKQCQIWIIVGLFASGCSSKIQRLEGTTWRSGGREIKFLSNATLEFRLDYRYKKKFLGVTYYEGTYSVSGDKLTIRLEDKDRGNITYNKIVIDGDRMTIVDPEGGEEMVFEKVK